MSRATIKRETQKVLNSFFDINPIDKPRSILIDAFDTDLLSDAITQSIDRIYKLKIKYNEDNENLYCTGCKRLINLGEKYILSQEDYLGEIIEKAYSWECAPEDPEDDIYIPES